VPGEESGGSSAERRVVGAAAGSHTDAGDRNTPAGARDARHPACSGKHPLASNYAKANILPIPTSLSVNPFYTKYVDAQGIPVIGYPRTRYYGEHIFVHEFAHAMSGGRIWSRTVRLPCA
jgi:hypothetical protein